MALYEDLIPSVAIHLGPCPDRNIYFVLQDTIRDFCKTTRIWLHDCTPFGVTTESLSYRLTVPEESIVIHLWGLEGRKGQYQENPDYYYTHENELVFDKLKSERTVTPLVSLMPSSQSESFPDFLREYFKEYLVSGAVARLQMQPFRDWSEPNMAAAHLQKYEQGVLEAKRMLDDGLNRSKVRNRVKAHYL